MGTKAIVIGGLFCVCFLSEELYSGSNETKQISEYPRVHCLSYAIFLVNTYSGRFDRCPKYFHDVDALPIRKESGGLLETHQIAPIANNCVMLRTSIER